MSVDQPVTSADVARYLAALNAEGESNVEKILVRQVNPTLYACQIWFEGDPEPSSEFISVSE